MRRVTALALLALLLGSSMAFGAAGDLTYGGDLRVRETIFDKAPFVAGDLGEYNFFRIRPRVWLNYGISDNMAVKIQVTNEFRHYIDPDRDNWDFPDEWLIDNLYLDLKDLAGGNLDLRIGRQNLIYGTGKLILDGTP
jgi:alginate export protein